MIRKSLWGLLLFCLSSMAVLAQADTIPPGVYADTLDKGQKNSVMKILQEMARKREMKIKKGKMMITPFLAPGYTPELGLTFAGGALVSFKTDKKDPLMKRTSIPLSLSYSTRGSLVFSSQLTSYWMHDKMRIDGDFWFKDMPDNYWGIGYENAATIPQTDSTTAYTRRWWWVNPRFLFQVASNFFLGVSVDYNYTQGRKASEGVEDDPYYIEFNDRPLNGGIGVIVRYDSRDIPVDAREGWFLNFTSTFYSRSFGGDNNYQIYMLDYRGYKTMRREGQTLAWQLKTRFGSGSIPYGEMAQLGTPFDLRGYLWGQYRDRNMAFAILEYRHMFWRPKKNRVSKSGLVGWFAGGTIFHEWEKTADINRWLPNGGIGYRLEVQPRMMARIDLGFGRNTTGFYFNFYQAF